MAKTIKRLNFTFQEGPASIKPDNNYPVLYHNLFHCMQKFHLLVINLFVCVSGYAQTDTLSKADKALLDSMMANDEFLKMMKEDTKNTLDISAGIGNGAFSSDNKAANATGMNNQLIYTPSVVYRLKNGFSFGITGYFTNDSAKHLELYQTGIMAGYDYYGNKVHAGLSYTRFLSDLGKYNTKSLYQNDLYGYLKKAKGLLQPGIAAGFSNGSYKEALYTVVKQTVHLLLPLPNGRDTVITRSGIDSTDNKASYFSVSASVEHDFSFYKLFDKNDELDFVPSLLVNFGSDQLSQTHQNKIFDRKRLNKLKKQQASSSFEPQSVAASFDFSYGVGKYFLQANVYFDYYLPQTTSKRLSTIFAVSTGFSF